MTLSVSTRFNFGEKRKVKKVPEILSSDDSWKEIVLKAFPELSGKDWHGEYDDGCWIESAEDWSLAVELWNEQKESSGQKMFLVSIVVDANACDICESCACRGQKSCNHTGSKSALPPGTIVSETQAGVGSSSSTKRKPASSLPPPLTDEEHDEMNKHKPALEPNDAGQTGPTQNKKKRKTASTGGWQSGPVLNTNAGATNGWQSGVSAQPGVANWNPGSYNQMAQFPGGNQYGAPIPYGGPSRNMNQGGRGGGMMFAGRGAFQGGQQPPMMSREGRKQAHNDQMASMREQIIDMMRRQGEPMSMLWIRKALGNAFGAEKPKTKTVNWLLYNLQEQGIVSRQETGNSKPNWMLL